MRDSFEWFSKLDITISNNIPDIFVQLLIRQNDFQLVTIRKGFDLFLLISKNLLDLPNRVWFCRNRHCCRILPGLVQTNYCRFRVLAGTKSIRDGNLMNWTITVLLYMYFCLDVYLWGLTQWNLGFYFRFYVYFVSWWARILLWGYTYV